MCIFAESDLCLHPRWRADLGRAWQMTSSARTARRGGDIVESSIGKSQLNLPETDSVTKLFTLK